MSSTAVKKADEEKKKMASETMVRQPPMKVMFLYMSSMASAAIMTTQ